MRRLPRDTNRLERFRKFNRVSLRGITEAVPGTLGLLLAYAYVKEFFWANDVHTYI